MTQFLLVQPAADLVETHQSMPDGCVMLAAGKAIHSSQYSLTEYYSPVHKGEVQLPAIYFLYDLSPIMVAVKDGRGGLAHLLVRICAVVGGVFAVTGMLLAVSGLSMKMYCVFANCFRYFRTPSCM